MTPMQTLPFQIGLHLDGWLPGAGVMIATLLVAAITRIVLERLSKVQHWNSLHQLAPSIFNTICVIGLKIFIDLAPFEGKTAIWLDGAVYVLSIFIYLALLLKASLIGLEWSLYKANNSETLRRGFIPMIRNLITLFIITSGGIMILKYFNYDVMSLITALGVGSLAVGLAAKDTLSHMISGFILIIDRNLRPGDRINLSGIIGDVDVIGLRSTQIRVDGNTLIVPNSELVNTKILNLSTPTREITCSTSIRIPYNISFLRVRDICFSILSETKGLSPSKTQSVNLISLSEGHQLIHIGFWVLELSDGSAAVSEFNELLASRLQKENIPLVAPSKS